MVPLSLLFLQLLSLGYFARGGIVPKDYELSSGNYDFIVVGGGNSGNVIANRLSEDPQHNVLVIEAGPSYEGVLAADIPFLCASLAPNSPYDWNFTTTSQEGLGGRSIPYPRGHILGGSSGINYMVYTRSSADDYDRYAELSGDDGWSWDNMQQYWRKNEQWIRPHDDHNTTGQYDPAIHNTDGTGITSVTLAGHPSPIDWRVIEAAKEYGGDFKYNIDINSGNPLGIGYVQNTLRGPRRESSATSYLAPQFLERPNLHVILNTQVSRLLESGDKSGIPEFRTVEYRSSVDGGLRTVTARKEVILSAGAVGSPHILLNSGIGDKSVFAQHGIQAKVDLPDVGKNLSDHPLMVNSWRVALNDTHDDFARDPELQQRLIGEWLADGSGEYLVNVPLKFMAFVRLPEDHPVLTEMGDPSSGPRTPHYELVMTNGLFFPLPEGYYFSIASVVMNPTSRGAVILNSPDPFAPPLIDPAYYQTEYDRRVMAESVRGAQRFITASSWQDYIVHPVNGLDQVRTSSSGATKEEEEADLQTYIRENSRTIYHPVGSASMSPHGADWGVVDPDLRVKKVRGVRIMDASVLPFTPAAHPMAVLYAFAERASDIIKSAYTRDGKVECNLSTLLNFDIDSVAECAWKKGSPVLDWLRHLFLE